MKKYLIVAMCICSAAVLATGCGKKKAAETVAETTVATEAATETTAMPSSEALETNVVSCAVQKIEDGKISVETDEGLAMTFDTSKAAMDPGYAFMPGDEVDITFEGSEPTDGMAVLSVDMNTPFEYVSEDFNEDSTAYGVITAITDTSVTVDVEDDGRGEAVGNFTFTIAPYSTTVTQAGAQVGTGALINYTGDITSNPVCVRICTDDIMEDPASDIYEITGTIDKVEGRYIFVTAGDSHLTLTSDDDAVLSQASALVGQAIKAEYSGSVRVRVLDINAIKQA